MSAAVTQPTSAPTAKVTAAGVGGLVATVVLAVCDGLGAFDLNTVWDGIIATVSAFAAGYLTKSRTSERA